MWWTECVCSVLALHSHRYSHIKQSPPLSVRETRPHIWNTKEQSDLLQTERQTEGERDWSKVIKMYNQGIVCVVECTPTIISVEQYNYTIWQSPNVIEYKDVSFATSSVDDSLNISAASWSIDFPSTVGVLVAVRLKQWHESTRPQPNWSKLASVCSFFSQAHAVLQNNLSGIRHGFTEALCVFMCVWVPPALQTDLLQNKAGNCNSGSSTFRNIRTKQKVYY